MRARFCSQEFCCLRERPRELTHPGASDGEHPESQSCAFTCINTLGERREVGQPLGGQVLWRCRLLPGDALGRLYLLRRPSLHEDANNLR